MSDSSDASEAGRALGALGASKGGKARAEKLTPEQRREIAKKAVEARWAKAKDKTVKTPLLRVTHGSADHPLKIFDIEIPCYVLEDETRVITNRGLQRSLGMAESGGAKRIADLVERFGAKGVDVKDLPARIKSPIEFQPQRSGRSAYGYEATVLADICDVVLAAREARVLNKQYKKLAEHCELLVRGFARVGIIALVDEATGYQAARPWDALAKYLEMFVAKEIRKWVKTFPDEYYENMYRLRNWAYSPHTTERTSAAARYTNNIVYERLAPMVLEELQRVTPRLDSGRLKHHYHRRLTEDVGHPRLREHLSAIIALMRASDDWEQFMRMVDRSFPKFNTTGPLALKYED